MSVERRQQADERLARALAEAGVADSRKDYRERLRRLKKENAAAFQRATEHYEQEVLPGLLEAADPLGVWIEFGIALGGMSGPGRTVAVDRTGRSAEWRGGYPPGALLLFVPEDRLAEALALAVPAAPSAAQSASLDLLVLKKLSL